MAASLPSSEQRLLRNPAARWQRFDGVPADRWIVELDDVHGRTQRLVVSERLRELLHAFDAGTTISAVLAGCPAALREPLRPLLEQAVQRRMLIAHAADTAAPVQAQRPAYLSFMLPLIPAGVVHAVARATHRLFSPGALAIGLAFAVLGAVLLPYALSLPRQQLPGSSDVLLTGALLAIGLLLHEFGHASAAHRYGARAVDIGVGWYAVMPVAYANLSEAWRFTRVQRAIVDAAGVYLQALWMGAMVLAHLCSGHPALLTAAALTAASIAWNLNPLLRMDGYWLCSDLLGITDLRHAASTALRERWSRLRSRPAARTRVRMRSGIATLLALHAAASSVFFVLLAYWATGWLYTALSATLPDQVARLAAGDWHAGSTGDALLLCAAVLWHCVEAAMLARFLLHGLRRLLRAWRGCGGRRRAAA